MILCDTIKHHNKNGKPCALGFWHFLTSEKIAGFSASLSAKSSMSNIVELFFYALSGLASFMVLIVNRIRLMLWDTRLCRFIH